MKINQDIGCVDFPCQDVVHDLYLMPQIEIDVDRIKMVVISEASPKNPQDDFYAGGEPLFAETTLIAFRDAGLRVSSIDQLLEQGIYLTNAVKCGKMGYGIKAGTIKTCSHILEQELAQFPNIEVYMLMGDVAIKAMNTIAARQGLPRVIPAGSTYKIRGGEYDYGDKRAFPSYLQAGPAFFIEKSKRRMIAEDLSAALALIQD